MSTQYAREPGVYRGLTDAEYDQIPAVRSSELKLIESHSPAHVYWERDHPREETDATRLGTAAHLALLQPSEFERQVVVSPYAEYRSGEAKAWRAEQQAAGKIPLKEAEHQEAVAIRDGILRNRLARQLLTGGGQPEPTLIWREEGVLCKARPDWITYWDDLVTMVDIKTLGGGPDGPPSLAEERVQAIGWRRGWHVQEWWYRRGMTALFGDQPRHFLWIVCEKREPWFTRVFYWEPEDMRAVEQRLFQLLETYEECSQTENWFGYEGGPYPLRIPRRIREL